MCKFSTLIREALWRIRPYQIIRDLSVSSSISCECKGVFSQQNTASTTQVCTAVFDYSFVHIFTFFFYSTIQLFFHLFFHYLNLFIVFVQDNGSDKPNTLRLFDMVALTSRSKGVSPQSDNCETFSHPYVFRCNRFVLRHS